MRDAKPRSFAIHPPRFLLDIPSTSTKCGTRWLTTHALTHPNLRKVDVIVRFAQFATIGEPINDDTGDRSGTLGSTGQKESLDALAVLDRPDRSVARTRPAHTGARPARADGGSSVSASRDGRRGWEASHLGG